MARRRVSRGAERLKTPSGGKVSAYRGMFSFDTDEVGHTGLKPSQALPRQLPRRGSFLHLPVTTNKAPPSGELASRSDD